jgi:WD40 repeat protein
MLLCRCTSCYWWYRQKYPTMVSFRRSTYLTCHCPSSLTKPECTICQTPSFIRSSVLSGHEDWIRGLDFRTSNDFQVLVLASGSQDATIRLWNIESYKKESRVQTDASKGPLSDDLLDAFEESLGDFADDEGGRQISLKRHIMSIKSSNGR